MAADDKPFMRSPCWTSDIPDTEHTRFFKSVDWAASSLGPLDQWSLPLRLYTYQLLADSCPSVIYWGPERVAIYNEAFVPLVGDRHPAMMGIDFKRMFPEIYVEIEPLFAEAERSKVAVPVHEIPLFVFDNGFLEERYFTGNFNPLVVLDGSIGGVYNGVHEVTKRVLADRRRRMLNLIALPQQIHTTETIGEHVLSCLRTNKRDITMALLYQAVEEPVQNDFSLTLRGALGVPDDHQLAVKQMKLSSDKQIAALLRQAKSETVTITVDDLFAGIAWSGFDEPSTSVSILPLSLGERLYGFLVIGLNPRRHIDDDHANFVLDLSRQVSATIAAAVSAEDGHKRQKRLEKDLADSERNIRYLAQHMSVGMQHVSTDGRFIWANDHYYILTDSQPSDFEDPMSFFNAVYEEDRPRAQTAWEALLTDGEDVSMELRLRRLYKPPAGDLEPATILVFAFLHTEEDGTKSVMACLTDVSRLKWAERWQARSAEEAREAKRQQEEFIDAISHEVRNPLSAVSQLADAISTSLADLQGQEMTLERCIATLKENVEDATTILHCTKHQKRIVDDVLTLSKMNFMLLSLSIVSVQPRQLTSEISKIVELHAKLHNIKINLLIDPSFKEIESDWVLCDPVRIHQIFINLVGNAVKFTKDEAHRQITIRFGAVSEKPRQYFPENIFWPPEQTHDQTCNQTPVSSPDGLYLTFSISDSGVGMELEETRRLFKKFKQANSRTFVKYGGPGLGLFISQKLAEKQKGEIGVYSEPGAGSTFTFYVHIHRADKMTVPKTEQVLPTTKPQLQDQRKLSVRSVTNSATLPEDPKPIKPNVLLVEDNLVNQKVLCKQLTKAGCNVYTANHGVEALEILRTTSCWKEPISSALPLDVILMDWEMPVMDGLTCSQEIRSLENAGELTTHLPIIAITANSRKEQIERALEAGMDDVMTKPFLIKELMEKLSAWGI